MHNILLLMNYFLSLDDLITNALYLQDANLAVTRFLYIFASVLIYALPILLIWMAIRSSNSRIVAVKIFLAAVVAWQGLSSAIGNFLYQGYGWRERPFAQLGYDELLFEQPAKAFPSDHAAVLFVAVMLLYYYGYAKYARWLLVVALVVSLGRVMIGFHWFGDILGGVAVAALTAGLFIVFDKPITKLIKKVDETLVKKDKLF